jgi:hypothetical protein
MRIPGEAMRIPGEAMRGQNCTPINRSLSPGRRQEPAEASPAPNLDSAESGEFWDDAARGRIKLIMFGNAY